MSPRAVPQLPGTIERSDPDSEPFPKLLTIFLVVPSHDSPPKEV